MVDVGSAFWQRIRRWWNFLSFGMVKFDECETMRDVEKMREIPAKVASYTERSGVETLVLEDVFEKGRLVQSHCSSAQTMCHIQIFLGLSCITSTHRVCSSNELHHFIRSNIKQ